MFLLRVLRKLGPHHLFSHHCSHPKAQKYDENPKTHWPSPKNSHHKTLTLFASLTFSSPLLTPLPLCRGVFFSTARAAVPPVPLSEVADWQLGSTASTASDADADADDRAEQNLQLTLVTRPDPRRHSAPRMLTLQFSSRDVRNATLSGLRALCADAQLLPSRLTAAAIMAEEAGPLMREKQRTSRRLSVRDVVLEDQRRRLSVGGGGSPLGQSHQSFASPTSASLSHASTSAPGSTSAPAAMLLQVCAMANELADRDKCIETLQQREGAFQQRLSEKEAQAKQSMYTSYQMGKKLQDTLFDRAKLEEELEALKAQLDGIRTGTA